MFWHNSTFFSTSWALKEIPSIQNVKRDSDLKQCLPVVFDMQCSGLFSILITVILQHREMGKLTFNLAPEDIIAFNPNPNNTEKLE